MIETQQVQDGRVQVRNMHPILHGREAQFVCRPDGLPALFDALRRVAKPFWSAFSSAALIWPSNSPTS